MQASKTGPESKKGWGKKIAFWFGVLARPIEFFAVILAVVAFFYDFFVGLPRDRAARNAQLIAQITDLSKGEEAAKVSPAISNIMEILAKKKVLMRGIVVPGMNLHYAQLSGGDLSEADLSGANLFYADLSGADLTGADLSEANLRGANLSRADLTGADLGRTILIDANLNNANLSNTRLNVADLSRASLNEAHLIGADLTRAYLGGADLSNAIFNNANLIGANLGGTDLSNAIFNEAHLSGADLFRADLNEADLEGVYGLTQDQLDVVKPSPPPRNLPKNLSWPFKKRDDGAWAPINEQVPANPRADP